MYSEALSILVRNTVNYMIEDMQNQLEQANESLAEITAILAEKDAEIACLKALLNAQENP